MDEFSLIDVFFKQSVISRDDVMYGIGDDAACVSVPNNHQLLISTDTLVADVHFLKNWDPYDIAWKAAMVNVSDIAAMAGMPCWVSLALTLPELDQAWLSRFSQGFHDALGQFNIALIGGDTTRGPLSITLTIHGVVPNGKAVRRAGACVGDKVYVSGDLGAAALAVTLAHQDIDAEDKQVLMQKLQRPIPRVDLANILQQYASAAIDISDGLSADLNHICVASDVGACLFLNTIPIHPLVEKYQPVDGFDLALSGGDDYELCFTVAPAYEKECLACFDKAGLHCFAIGVIEKEPGLHLITTEGERQLLFPKGYRHF